MSSRVAVRPTKRITFLTSALFRSTSSLAHLPSFFEQEEGGVQAVTNFGEERGEPAVTDFEEEDDNEIGE